MYTKINEKWTQKSKIDNTKKKNPKLIKKQNFYWQKKKKAQINLNLISQYIYEVYAMRISI